MKLCCLACEQLTLVFLLRSGAQAAKLVVRAALHHDIVVRCRSGMVTMPCVTERSVPSPAAGPGGAGGAGGSGGLAPGLPQTAIFHP